MKKVNPKKLSLSRETVGKLTDEQTRAIKGGVADLQDYPITSDSVHACCC